MSYKLSKDEMEFTMSEIDDLVDSSHLCKLLSKFTIEGEFD